MPKRRSSTDGEFTGGDEFSDIFQMYGDAKMRIPANARMSENIEDRRGENFMQGNKLSLQKTRGQREDNRRGFFPTGGPSTDIERDIDAVAKRSRMNADLLEPGMSPTEERYALDQGIFGYAAEKKRRDFDELMQRVTRENNPSGGKDRRGFEDLIEETSKGYAKGGMVTKSKSKKGRGDGICIKGHTKGRMY
jgi:hypothetical protein